MTTRLLIGDVFARMAELDDHSFDLIVTSPPFLALRSYLPDDHPDKDLEIGSEATPADYLDTLLALSAEWRRLLAPHGSIAVELGDTYAGSGGAGGDYNEDGWREGQGRFSGSAVKRRANGVGDEYRPSRSGRQRESNNRECPTCHSEGGGYVRVGADDWEWEPCDRCRGTGYIPGAGWPLDKSLTGIPTLYAWSLAYGRNLLTGQPSPAGRWRVRNVKPWIRSNPPVGALGDKERPATSYITVACVGASRWFDLDAVRTPPAPANRRTAKGVDQIARTGKSADRGGNWASLPEQAESGGAPPLDWWHQVDAVIDNVIDQRAGKTAGWSSGDKRTGKNDDGSRGGNWSTFTPDDSHEARHSSVGARGVHIRRALEAAGILTTLDAIDCSPRGYAGAHYAVWPPELVRQLIDEMCPRRVCRECGVPSRRIVGEATYTDHNGHPIDTDDGWRTGRGGEIYGLSGGKTPGRRTAPTLGWSDCGHNTWRPGRICDPFAGSGTTLAVATDMNRDAVGIDIDIGSYGLTIGRFGPLVAAMEFEIDWPAPDLTRAALPRAADEAVYLEWAHMLGDRRAELEPGDETDPAADKRRNDLAAAYVKRRDRRPVVDVPGQGGLFEEVSA